MKKDWRRVREDIKKEEAKKREAEEKLRALHQQVRQAENEEIVAVIRAMTEKGGDVMQTLKTVQEQQRSFEQARGALTTNHESEVEIDD